MEHSKHIIRAVLLLVLALVVFIVVRHFAIPDTFGEAGQYRFASVADIAAREPVHGGRDSCAECHDDLTGMQAEGAHATVPCELCHAPLSTHVKAGEHFAEMRVQRTHVQCAWCHRRLVARPATFPQVVFDEHVRSKGGELTPEVCLECHDAHDPAD